MKRNILFIVGVNVTALALMIESLPIAMVVFICGLTAQCIAFFHMAPTTKP